MPPTVAHYGSIAGLICCASRISRTSSTVVVFLIRKSLAQCLKTHHFEAEKLNARPTADSTDSVRCNVIGPFPM
jgi:hypothetical protein